MNGQLKDSVVLITGSSIGIGRATALEFAREGCQVVVTYYQDEQEARETADRCRELGAPEVMVQDLNIMDGVSINEAVDAVVQEKGRIDILVNNAGVITWKKLADQSFAEIEQQIRTNLEGTIKMTKAALPHVKGMVINMASPTALHGHPTLTAYAASKGGIISFTKTLAMELEPVKVYNVIPGETATRMTDFEGDPPEEVAEVTVRLARGEYDIESGENVSVKKPPASRQKQPVRPGPTR